MASNIFSIVENGVGAATNGIDRKQNINITDSVDNHSKSNSTNGTDGYRIFHPHKSPRKRLETTSPSNNKRKAKFMYGNYETYYSYRNQCANEVNTDVRLSLFEGQRALFAEKDVLDIGCNSGHITMEVAKRFPVKSITGIDIDRKLINRALTYLKKQKKEHDKIQRKRDLTMTFPFNVVFEHGNYVLRDDVLLDIENEQFDMILCLSVTKWIHLNFGDSGLKRTFKRMYLQLRPGGRLILEPQHYKSYAKRKRLTEETLRNYNTMSFLPKDFSTYLLSPEIGFESESLLGTPDHISNGFRRQIHIFQKAVTNDVH